MIVLETSRWTSILLLCDYVGDKQINQTVIDEINDELMLKIKHFQLLLFEDVELKK